MAICRMCGGEFEWGFCEGRWVLLEPRATHDGMDRAYVDENGELRADHRDKHGAPAVNVTRLGKRVPATHAEEEEEQRKALESTAALPSRRGADRWAQHEEDADLAAAGRDDYGTLDDK